MKLKLSYIAFVGRGHAFLFREYRGTIVRTGWFPALFDKEGEYLGIIWLPDHKGKQKPMTSSQLVNMLANSYPSESKASAGYIRNDPDFENNEVFSRTRMYLTKDDGWHIVPSIEKDGKSYLLTELWS